MAEAQPTPPAPPRDAVAQAAGTFASTVKSVNFVSFVDSLITGVYESIVSSNLSQMKQFADLVASVARSTDQFAKTEIRDADAQGFLMSSAPSLFALGEGGELAMAPEVDPATFAQRMGALGLTTNPDAPTSAQELVTSARLKLAEQRQQLLATMVLMGINRIVVTDGEINAKVVFDVNARTQSGGERVGLSNDTTTGTSKGNDVAFVTMWTGQDYTGQSQQLHPGSYDLERFRIGNDTLRSLEIPSGWRVTLYLHHRFTGPEITLTANTPRLPASFDKEVSSMRIYGFVTTGSDQEVTVRTVDTNSSSKSDEWLEAKANLTGEVGLRFKSETFPLDRFSPDATDELRKKAAADPGDTII